MEVRVFKTADQAGQTAAGIICDCVKKNPSCVLGLATGATPLPAYKKMIEEYNEGRVSFKDVKTFNLDEYCDLPRSHKNSYYSFMVENLFSKTDIDMKNVDFLDGNAPEQEESKRYAEAIKAAGGIDIQILGIGRNGHIAFNEPSDEFTDEAWKVKLTESTIEANSIYFDDIPMPRYAFTMGIGSIMRAKKIILIATGESKAQAVRDMINGEVTPRCPASVLQNHEDALILLDEAAASLL